MNNAGARDERLIVILNDNDMSIAPPTGALSRLPRAHHLERHLPAPARHRQAARQAASRRAGSGAPRAWRNTRATSGRAARWFEELGFYYVGPIDGHDLDHLLPVLKNVRDAKQGPILVHVVTKKGKGYAPAEASDDKYHGVAKFNVVTGAQVKPKPNAPSLHARVRREPHRGGAQGRQDRRHHRRDAGRHRARPLRQGIPRPHLRRRHRRAARGDLRRRPRDARASSRSPRSTRPSCSAPTTRSCTTSRSSACRCALRSTAPASSAPTARRMPARSTSPTSAACPASS